MCQNLFCGFNFREITLPAMLYCNKLIFTELIFTNLQRIAKYAKFTAHENFVLYSKFNNCSTVIVVVRYFLLYVCIMYFMFHFRVKPHSIKMLKRLELEEGQYFM